MVRSGQTNLVIMQMGQTVLFTMQMVQLVLFDVPGETTIFLALFNSPGSNQISSPSRVTGIVNLWLKLQDSSSVEWDNKISLICIIFILFQS